MRYTPIDHAMVRCNREAVLTIDKHVQATRHEANKHVSTTTNEQQAAIEDNVLGGQTREQHIDTLMQVYGKPRTSIYGMCCNNNNNHHHHHHHHHHQHSTRQMTDQWHLQPNADEPWIQHGLHRMVRHQVDEDEMTSTLSATKDDDATTTATTSNALEVATMLGLYGVAEHLILVRGYASRLCKAVDDAADDTSTSNTTTEATSTGSIKVVRPTVLHMAAINNDTRMIELIGSHSSQQVINASCEHGTALMMASRACNRAAVAHGADATLMQRDEQGNTALHHAARGGSLAVVRELVEAGGVELVQVKNNDGLTAQQEAHRRARVEVEDYVSERDNVDVGGKHEAGTVAVVEDQIKAELDVAAEAITIEQAMQNIYGGVEEVTDKERLVSTASQQLELTERQLKQKLIEKQLKEKLIDEKVEKQLAQQADTEQQQQEKLRQPSQQLG
jgi:hypothetical protein